MNIMCESLLLQHCLYYLNIRLIMCMSASLYSIYLEYDGPCSSLCHHLSPTGNTSVISAQMHSGQEHPSEDMHDDCSA